MIFFTQHGLDLHGPKCPQASHAVYANRPSGPEPLVSPRARAPLTIKHMLALPTAHD